MDDPRPLCDAECFCGPCDLCETNHELLSKSLLERRRSNSNLHAYPGQNVAEPLVAEPLQAVACRAQGCEPLNWLGAAPAAKGDAGEGEAATQVIFLRR